MTRAAVMGAGSWGTAFSLVLCDAGTPVTLWARRPEIAEMVNERRENPEYLAGVRLPEQIRATHDPAEAMDGADVVIVAVPSQTCRENLAGWAPHLPADVVVVSLMKGIELATTKRMSEVISEVADLAPDRVAVITGPNLSREIAERQPAASVVACADPRTARRVQQVCHAGYFRPYTNTDVVGCELAGAVKNVIAIAVGMAVGLDLGNNAVASLITRGLAETAWLGEALGADPLTFAGLAGLGDLVATCTSRLSRNRSFGEGLARGMTVEEIVSHTRQVAEGVKSCRSILGLARKFDVDMPITQHVVDVVHHGVTVPEAVRSLLARNPRSEREPSVHDPS